MYSYEPELHPGVTYKLKEPKATLKIFSTGSVTVTGSYFHLLIRNSKLIDHLSNISLSDLKTKKHYVIYPYIRFLYFIE